MMKAIGPFLLLLLKVLGWALLALLLVLLTLLLLALFVPVRYDALVENERSMEPGQRNPVANLRVRLRVGWLLRFVHVCIRYGPGGIENDIRVAGIDIKKALAWLSRKKEEKKKEAKKKEAKKKRAKAKKRSRQAKDPVGSGTGSEKSGQSMEAQFSPEPEAQGQMQEEESGYGKGPESQEQFLNKEPGFKAVGEGRNSEKKAESKEKKQKRKAAKRKGSKRKESSRKQERRSKEPSRQEREAVPGSLGEPGIFSKIRSQIHRIHAELSDQVNRHAASHLWKELLKLFKSYRPRELKVDMTFSLADPALTGGVVGIISLMPWIYRYPCSVIPDFTSDRLYIEGEVAAKGRVFLCVFLLGLLRMLRDKEFMQAFRRLMGWNGP